MSLVLSARVKIEPDNCGPDQLQYRGCRPQKDLVMTTSERLPPPAETGVVFSRPHRRPPATSHPHPHPHPRGCCHRDAHGDHIQLVPKRPARWS